MDWARSNGAAFARRVGACIGLALLAGCIGERSGARPPPRAPSLAPASGEGAAAQGEVRHPLDQTGAPLRCKEVASGVAPSTDSSALHGAVDPSDRTPTTPGEISDHIEPPQLEGPEDGGTTPLDDVTDDQLSERLKDDISAMGSLSVGRTNAGVLIGGEQMPEGDGWTLVSPNQAWGTHETVEALKTAIGQVRKQFADTPPLYIGHISGKRGGYLYPHVSHQAGRDVDISYYLKSGHVWYARATKGNLDLPRTWAFVRALLTETDIDLILIDISVQKILRDYALESGEDPDWVNAMFQVSHRARRPAIYHVPGHATHIHIRFRNAMAEELGRRAYPLLVKRRLVRPFVAYHNHTIQRGETLSHIARRYHLKIEALKKLNRLKSDRIREGKALRVPVTRGVPNATKRIVIPPRRLPRAVSDRGKPGAEPAPPSAPPLPACAQ